jgi:hypothetical protein
VSGKAYGLLLFWWWYDFLFLKINFILLIKFVTALN